MQHHSNILVVEDRGDWQAIVSVALTHQGYTPYIATSYHDALHLLDAYTFDLAIIDPVLDVHNRFNRDGLSVIQHLRSVQPHASLVVITGSLTRDMHASLQQLYPDAPVLLKESWNPVDFTALIRQLLGKQQPPPVAAVTEPATTPAIPETCPIPPDAESCETGCPRVLLVENRPDWQAIVARVLDAAGIFWRIATNAQDSLRELERESFHLVVLDLKLQANDLPITSSEGWLLLDYLVEAHPSTSVVILSGEACPGDVADLLTRYPVVGFIEKQRFTPQVILDAVARATRAPTLRIQTLGPFRIWRDGQALTAWERPQTEMVVKILLVRRAQGGRMVAADDLITRLWPDADEESGRKKLLPLISNARRTIEPDIEPRDSHFIVRGSNGYFFDLGQHVTWDLLNFREHLRLGQQCMHEQRWEAAAHELEQMRALYHGDFLADDHYIEWIMDVRREVARDFCDGLVLLADSYTALQRYVQAIQVCEAALQKDPLREGVYRRLMCLHTLNGDKGQALKVYRDCTILFEELFGENPTPITRFLSQAIATDDPLAHEVAHWIDNGL